MLVLLDHVCLPWYCPDNRVVVVFQVFPLLLACLGLSVSGNTLQFLLPSISSSPFSRYQMVISILPVHHCILDSRISHPHQVVAANGSKHNGRGYIWLTFYGSEQTTKSIGQNAKGVFAHSPAAACSVIVDSMWDVQAMPPSHMVSSYMSEVVRHNHQQKNMVCLFLTSGLLERSQLHPGQ